MGLISDVCYHAVHNNMCSAKGRVLPGLFVFTRSYGREGSR